MPEVIINGPAGRIEGRYHHNNAPNAPIALFLHPHPQHGGTMNNKVIYTLYYMFVRRGFSCLRFNFRGVGRSQGTFSRGEGESSPMPQQRLIGSNHIMKMPVSVGYRGFRFLAPGLACSY